MNISVLEKRLRSPREFEEDFYDFWKKLDIKTDIEKTLAEQTRFDSRVLGGTTITEFFKTGIVASNTNLNQFIPPESEHQLITSLRLWEGADSDIANTDWVAGISSAVAKNSKISITNNGVKALDEVPLSEFLNDLTTRDNGKYDLDEPIPWVGQTKLIVSIETFDAPTLNTNLRIGLKGLAYIS